MSNEQLRRHEAMIAHWESLGHPRDVCSGHTYPMPGCPAPEVHAQVFPGPDDRMTRPCPVNPDACLPVHGWESFLTHVYEAHTDPTVNGETRWQGVEAILKRSPAERQAPGSSHWHTPGQVQRHTVVPKVTADPRTAALWAVINEDPVSAASLLARMGLSERRAYLAQLTELINLLWTA